MYKLIKKAIDNDNYIYELMTDIALYREYLSLKANLYILTHYMPRECEYTSDFFKAFYYALYHEIKSLYESYIKTNTYHYVTNLIYELDLFSEE